MIDRVSGGDFAVLVHIELRSEADSDGLDEFRELARAAGVSTAAVVTARLDKPSARYFIGSGKAEELAACVREHKADLVLVNHALSSVQERNLEKLCQCRVLDRTTLILDIFAQRASSHEGKLQVELAQLRHLSTRLIRGWTHLERQKGGIGLRGPGETQLETDRRLLAGRVRQLKRRLERVSRQRNLSRRRRQRSETPVVSLVGYTNAGKSTLFNRLTDAKVLAADQLFATLDPTLRRLSSAGGRPLVMADTVGFISHLPHELVAAFKSTLEETQMADLLVHVVDASSPHHRDQIRQVNEVLAEIGSDQIPQIVVYNKIDQTDHTAKRGANGEADRIWLSALTGEGVDLLTSALQEHFADFQIETALNLPPQAGKLRSQLFELGAVKCEEQSPEGGWKLQVAMSSGAAEQLASQGGANGQLLREQLLCAK